MCGGVCVEVCVCGDVGVGVGVCVFHQPVTYMESQRN